MKLEFTVRMKLEDSFEKRIFNDNQDMLGPQFRKEFLSFLGFIMKVEREDNAEVECFIIKRLADDAPAHPDIPNDITGDAQ
jgi:hypothetical protein